MVFQVRFRHGPSRWEVSSRQIFELSIGQIAGVPGVCVHPCSAKGKLRDGRQFLCVVIGLSRVDQGLTHGFPLIPRQGSSVGLVKRSQRRGDGNLFRRHHHKEPWIAEVDPELTRGEFSLSTGEPECPLLLWCQILELEPALQQSPSVIDDLFPHALSRPLASFHLRDSQETDLPVFYPEDYAIGQLLAAVVCDLIAANGDQLTIETLGTTLQFIELCSRDPVEADLLMDLPLDLFKFPKSDLVGDPG